MSAKLVAMGIEGIRLAWADIVLHGDHPMLTIRRSFRGNPKNEASAATIPLSQDAVMLLREWRSQQEPSP